MLHAWKKNQMYRYRTGDNWLGNSIAETDLGAVVDHRQNMSQQCNVVIKKQTQFWSALIGILYVRH